MATLHHRREQQSPRAPVAIEWPVLPLPIVLAFGFTLMFAGLLTSVSSASRSCPSVAGWSAGSVKSSHEHEETVPVVFENTA